MNLAFHHSNNKLLLLLFGFFFLFLFYYYEKYEWMDVQFLFFFSFSLLSPLAICQCAFECEAAQSRRGRWLRSHSGGVVVERRTRRVYNWIGLDSCIPGQLTRKVRAIERDTYSHKYSRYNNYASFFFFNLLHFQHVNTYTLK